MTRWRKLLMRLGLVKAPTRSYTGAAVSRLTSSWTTQPLSVDADLQNSLPRLRARSRELEQNNDYAKRFLALLDQNVIGAHGIQLQARLRAQDGLSYKRKTNDAIEMAWWRWGQRGICDVTGQLCWTDVQRLVLRTVARDGECLVRLVRDYGNAYQFAVQVLETDHLDITLNADRLPNGHSIRMGVERNEWGRPVAYHLLRVHPGDALGVATTQARERVVAADLLHVYSVTRPGQTRGIPWMHSAMLRLNMLGGYEEAELVAARTAACKSGFFSSPTGEEYLGDGVDANGQVVESVEPGTFTQLPAGVTFTPYDPTHPTTSFADFVKGVLRGVASGLNVSYNTLASDLEGVNYSSIRQGVLDDRDGWRVSQEFLIENLCQPVFRAWLDMAVLSEELDLSIFDEPRVLEGCEWQARGWSWVDPYKDMQADIEAINAGLKTRTQCLAERGLDIEDVFQQLKQEQELAAQYGLTFATPSPSGANTNDAQHQDQQTLSNA
jgi:lambda family phage portal protein